MEESQIASLPPELAAEAQFLRRDWESRNGARVDNHPPSNALCKYQIEWTQLSLTNDLLFPRCSTLPDNATELG